MNLMELIPRNEANFVAEAQSILSTVDSICAINVPDVLRLPIRSYTAAKLLLNVGIRVVPHIRAIDHLLMDTVAIISELVDLGLQDVLIISGDPPLDPHHPIFDVSVTSLIYAVKSKHPRLNVYGALDPYRQSIKSELVYCHAKFESGADGVFTQPFFDLKFADIYLDQLRDTQVFLGISPVTTEQSMSYWKTRNHVVFPLEFVPTYEYNVGLTKRLLALAASYSQHTYLMPIRLDASAYASAVF
jgi:methylenetetrahydrofolate reductase (NADPH)